MPQLQPLNKEDLLFRDERTRLFYFDIFEVLGNIQKWKTTGQKNTYTALTYQRVTDDRQPNYIQKEILEIKKSTKRNDNL